jgi:hypothetical protein
MRTPRKPSQKQPRQKTNVAHDELLLELLLDDEEELELDEDDELEDDELSPRMVVRITVMRLLRGCLLQMFHVKRVSCIMSSAPWYTDKSTQLHNKTKARWRMQVRRKQSLVTHPHRVLTYPCI